MNRAIILSILLAATTIVHARDEGSNVPSTLKSVTVYRSGAELTHTASAFLKQGNNVLIIDNISNQVDVNSIQIKTPATVTILGVEFSANHLPPLEKTAREKMLDDSLERLQEDEEKIDLSITNTSDLLDVLKDNRVIKGEQNGLSVTELAKLMDYYKAKSLELQGDLQQLKSKKKKLEEQAGKIASQITEEQKKNISTAGRLTLQLSAAAEGKCDFTISYIAQNAYWKPYYDVRVDNISSPLKLIYRAKVVQTTGIDWKQVKLSLSTSTPSQKNSAPVLDTWFVGYIDPVTTLEKQLQGRVAGVSLLNDVVVVGYGIKRKEDSDEENVENNKPQYIVDGTPMSEAQFAKINPSAIKKMDRLTGSAATSLYGSSASNGVVVVTLKSGLEDYVSVADNTLDATFDIDMPYDIPTNGKEQSATLQVLDMKADYRHYAVPKLDAAAYLLAEIHGWEKLNLLPGEANIILENTYIGKSFIDPSATTDTLSLTLGRDERVIVKRQKVADYSSVKFLGSNKLQKFTYEVTVKNNKNEAVNFLLKDQFPISTNKDIEVTLVDAGNAEVNNETGLLDWKLTLAAGESKKVKFVYSIKYAKDKVVNIK